MTVAVNGSEEDITIKLNTGVLQTLLETTANDLLEVFKASRQVPEQSDDEVRGKILRELYGIKKALIDSKQQSESLENESISKAQCSKPGPSTSDSPPSVLKSAVIDLTLDSEHENPKSLILCKQSHKVVQKRSREDHHLSSPPAKRACSSSPMGNSKISAFFNNTVGSSSPNSQDTDDAASKNIIVLCTSQQHTLSRTSSLNSTTPIASGNTSAESDVILCVNIQANRKESIPSTSSPSGKSGFSCGSSVTFKAGSSKSRQKSNQEEANVPNERNTTEGVQQANSKHNQEQANVPNERNTTDSEGVQQANSKCDESSNGPQPTRNTTNSEKSATGPSHKTGIILLSEKASTSEASAKQNIINSQGSATSTRTKKIYKQNHLAMQDPKQSQASTSHGLSLFVSPTKGKVTGGKGSSRSTKRPRKKESNQESRSESADRKRGSRCPKSKRHLCPVCCKPDCGKCKNCL